ncbi:MAG: lipoprotein [Bauldia litoralis]|uniref:LPS translocon maturation chaperone LptM n=1 Tax=Bauldia litoralis TaxID=665467 RepID=UPI003297A71F
MALSNRRMVFRAALAAVLISTIGLSACGRKGALQPPPSAAAVEEPVTEDAVVLPPDS